MSPFSALALRERVTGGGKGSPVGPSKSLFRPSLVGCVVLAAACANPADNVPQAFVGEPFPEPGVDLPVAAGTAPAPAPAAAEGGAEAVVYAFGAGEAYPQPSRVEFLGAKVTRSHKGLFREFSGEIRLVEAEPTRSSVRVEIATNTLIAEGASLTMHLLSPDFFNTAAYPTATFTSTAITPAGEGYDITGNLTLRGVTKSIRFPATIAVADDRVTARAEFFIKRFDFGIVYPGAADNLIRDEVVIRLDIVALPA